MQEIILYAILALIVGGMLYMVLGRDVGRGADNPVDPRDFLKQAPKASPTPEPAEPVLASDPLNQGFQAIARIDPGFRVADFLDGAKQAYGMILDAYAEGDKATLAELLSDAVKDRYFDAIDARTSKGLTQSTDMARLIEAKPVDVKCDNKTATIKVAYSAELATALLDKDGHVVEGDLDVLSRVREIWSFERELKSSNPNWVLSGVEPHTTANDNTDNGKTNGPDHSPDT